LKILYCLKQDLKKVIFNYGFVFCVLITIGLCFTATLFRDSNNGQEYTVLGVLISFNKNWIKQNVMISPYDVFCNSTSSYLKMFIPIVAAFPFIPNFCSERNSGNIRFTITRTGKFRYYISKFLSSFIGGGLAISLGYIIYGLIVIPIFSSLSELNIGIFAFFTSFEIFKNVISNIAGMFIYGAVSTLPAFLFASIVRNRYIILCVPFMIIYIYQSIVNRMIIHALSKGKFDKIGEIDAFSPFSVQQIFSNIGHRGIIIFLNITYLLIALVLFIVFMNRRLDSGE